MKKLLLIISTFLLTLPVFSQTRITPTRSIEQTLNEKYCSGLFSTTDATYFDMLDDRNNLSAISYMNVLDWLQGRVAGLQVYRTSAYTRVPYIRNQRAAVYIDEVPVNDDFLTMLPISDIAMIKIIKNSSVIGGWRGPGGVISIYTIRGEDEEDSE